MQDCSSLGTSQGDALLGVGRALVMLPLPPEDDGLAELLAQLEGSSSSERSLRSPAAATGRHSPSLLPGSSAPAHGASRSIGSSTDSMSVRRDDTQRRQAHAALFLSPAYAEPVPAGL